MIKIAATIIILASQPQAFEYQENSPESLFPHQKAVSETTYPGGISNPALLPYINTAYITFSGARPYGLTELSSTTIQTGYSGKNTGLQLQWSQFGIKEYTEHILKTNTGIRLHKFISFGLSLNYYNLVIKAGEADISKNLIDGKISLLVTPVKDLFISYMRDNIYSGYTKKNTDLLDQRWSFGIGIKLFKGLFAAWNIHKNYYGYINSFEISVQILKNLALKGGYAKETATYSAGCALSYKHITFSYGFRFHPLLGNTHSAGLTLALDYLKTKRIDYKSRHQKLKNISTEKKININTCSLAKLKTIPGLHEKYAKRIYNYRKQFGNITYKTFQQLGMKRAEVRKVLPAIYGLEQNKKHTTYKKKKYKRTVNKKWRKFRMRQKKKQLFMKLLQQGLSASQAIKLTELTVNNDKKKLAASIQAFSIPTDKKRKIRALCGK